MGINDNFSFLRKEGYRKILLIPFIMARERSGIYLDLFLTLDITRIVFDFGFSP